jgi:predicted  nucleic acid-binding Zn-ribbon protein
MTEIEKFDKRLTALEQALAAVQHAASVDRKLTHEKHYERLLVKALNELTSIRDSVKAQKIRFETIGK